MPTLLDGFPVPQRGARKKDLKTMCLFSRVLFKYPVGVVMSISGEGSFLAGFLRGVWTEATHRGGGLGWYFYTNTDQENTSKN